MHNFVVTKNIDFETAYSRYNYIPISRLLGTVPVKILELPLGEVYLHTKLQQTNPKKIIKKYLRTTCLYDDGTFEYSSKKSGLLFNNIGGQSIKDLSNIRWIGTKSVGSLYNFYAAFAE